MRPIIHCPTLLDSREIWGASGEQSQSGVTDANKYNMVASRTCGRHGHVAWSPPSGVTTTRVTPTIVERIYPGTVVVPDRTQVNDDPDINKVHRMDNPHSDISTAAQALFRLAKRSTILHHTYLCAPRLIRSRIDFSGDLSGVYLEILFGERFAKGINVDSVRELVTTPRIMSSFITNPARDIPTDFKFQTYGASSVLSFKEGPRIADVITFGMVAQSDLIHGRSYPVRLSKHVVKSVDVIPIVREGQRLLDMLSMASGGGVLSLVLTEQGAITFSTKHTLIHDTDTSATCSLSASPRLIPVQSSFSRHQLAGTDAVPIYDLTNYIVGDQCISAEVVLTQRERPWLREIPLGTFVAVHSTVSLRRHGTNTTNYVTFNLKSIQILAFSL